ACINGVIKQREDGLRSVSSLGFHSLRHTFASVLANNGVNEETRMKLTGHSTREVHALYTHHEEQLLRAAIEVIPPVKPGDGPLLPELTAKQRKNLSAKARLGLTRAHL